MLTTKSSLINKYLGFFFNQCVWRTVQSPVFIGIKRFELINNLYAFKIRKGFAGAANFIRQEYRD
jgi:hypothetical protein